MIWVWLVAVFLFVGGRWFFLRWVWVLVFCDCCLVLVGCWWWCVVLGLLSFVVLFFGVLVMGLRLRLLLYPFGQCWSNYCENSWIMS